MDLLDDLQARGLVHDTTDLDALRKRLAEGPITLYWGCDPTAESLHVGNLVGQLVLRRFQLAGHKPIALAGGATGMIGDPSGRSSERNLLDAETLARNVAGIKAQLERLLDFDCGANSAELVDNATWTEPMTIIEFLRDVGKHVTVNQMLAKESVRARLDSGEGLSFTEFSYMLLQGHDFAWLAAHKNCEMQIGGSDQWGNITVGIDLVRKLTGRVAHGLTWPLVTRADGQKFGKSVDGAVWLDARHTSVYRFHQFWMQTADDDVERYLLQFTLLGLDEIAAIAAAHREAPERREGQRRLAFEVTALVHGEEAARAAEGAAAVLFGGDPTHADASALAAVAAEVGAAPVRLDPPLGIIEALKEAGLAASNGEARRLLDQGGVYVNGRRVDATAEIGPADRLAGRYVLLRKGKSNYRVLDAAG